MLLHLQRVKIRCCSLRSNQNISGMPGINTPEWLHKHHFSNTSLVAREPDGSSPVWQAQDVPWLLRSGRDYLSIGKEWGCQAPEVLWAVRSARKNDAIANKFTWPSSVSGGQAGECLSVRQWPPAFSPEILAGKRKMLTDHFKTVLGPLKGHPSILPLTILLLGGAFLHARAAPVDRGQPWYELPTERTGCSYCLCPIPQEPPWDKNMGKFKNQRFHSNQNVERSPQTFTHIYVCLCMYTIKLAKSLYLYAKPYFNITTILTYLRRGGN